ncbi:MAG: GTP 3',8-cyclase MoaA [Candidatus Magnetominusculus sp. LBB02]|nr:GTP 3',8-cyclase MoaA [Candidatus Magnetominusculus sp. LBB02]
MLKDNYGRSIDYLRISVTDRCNLRCVYCMPDTIKSGCHHDGKIASDSVLSYEEILRFVRAAAPLGIKKVRLTGGEPLVRSLIHELIRGIKSTEGIEELSLTTNGQRLSETAALMAECGLDRVNVSLDSLQPQRYAEITQGGSLDKAMAGIEAARAAGLLPIKLNMVPMSGVNDDEIEAFIRFGIRTGYQIRFIELMPTVVNEHIFNKGFIGSDEIRQRIEKEFLLTPLKVRKHGPARYFNVMSRHEPRSAGVIGIINAVTCRFCTQCNRLRLTSDGRLRPCLYSNIEVGLCSALRTNASKEDLQSLIIQAVDLKPERHHIPEDAASAASGAPFIMSGIGG